jgi:hypothetical protein
VTRSDEGRKAHQLRRRVVRGCSHRPHHRAEHGERRRLRLRRRLLAAEKSTMTPADSATDVPADSLPARCGPSATVGGRNAPVSDRATAVRARSHRVARRILTSRAFIRQPSEPEARMSQGDHGHAPPPEYPRSRHLSSERCCEACRGAPFAPALRPSEKPANWFVRATGH